MFGIADTKLSSGVIMFTAGACLSTMNFSVMLDALLPVSSKHVALQLWLPIEIPATNAIESALFVELSWAFGKSST